MLNVLFIAEDTSTFLNRNFYYLEQELAGLTNLMIWRKAGHIDFILKKQPVEPDFILIMNDMNMKMSPLVKGLADVDIPIGLFVNDVHRFIKLRRHYINKNKIKYIFTVAREQFRKIYPEFEYKMIWFPHFVNTEIYKDYGLEKDISFLLMGAVNDYYPLRTKIISGYKDDPRFVWYRHPGYKHFSEEEESQSIIGKQYARLLNRAKIFFTCPSVLQYAVIKYYEALACRSLLLAPTFKELEDLGFIPGHHFIPIEEGDFKDKAEYFLANDEERQKIIDQGYEFIQLRHSAKIRAQQLVKKMESLIKN